MNSRISEQFKRFIAERAVKLSNVRMARQVSDQRVIFGEVTVALIATQIIFV